MLREFIEQHPNHTVAYEALSRKTKRFILFDDETFDTIAVTGVCVKLLHLKHQQKILSTPVAKILDCDRDYIVIDGEIWCWTGGALTLVSDTPQPVLVQNLKTKTKTIATGNYDALKMLYDFTLNRNMHGTKEKHLRPLIELDRSTYGYAVRMNTNGSLEQTWNRVIDAQQYSMSYDEIYQSLFDNMLMIDENYNVVVEVPRVLTTSTINQANDALLKVFGTRNNKPIFEIKLEKMPSFKGELLC